MFERIEEQARSSAAWLRPAVAALGALVIAAGIAVLMVALVRYPIAGGSSGVMPIRLAFARCPTLARELQLAADIPSTSVAPTWQ